MKLKNFVLVGLLIGAASALAQAAPAGATGICKDGTYSTAADKAGACAGHKGVQTWYAATGAVPAKPDPAAPAASPPAKAGPAATAAAKTAVPGGGPGLVWVNTGSNVYHCFGTTYYGKTKTGKYVPEADAKSAGARPNGGKACSK